jgi:hypothetical protein
MPGEFVPRGYLTWVRTWLDDGRYVGPALWSMDERAIKISDCPDRAFDSPAEKEAVAVLLDKYNHPPDSADEAQSEETKSDNASAAAENSTSEESQPDTADSSDEESGAGDEDEKSPDDQNTASEEQNAEMTPEVDAGFAALAQTRIARAPFRYYIRLPLKRALSLWFDTHSQYYPFQGELLPLSDLDHDIRQQYWLPFFTALTWLYTLLGIAGGRCLWRARSLTARRWLILALLMTLTRLAFFSSLENPEPRYVVEIFPFLAILGGIAFAQIDFATLRSLLRQKAAN